LRLRTGIQVTIPRPHARPRRHHLVPLDRPREWVVTSGHKSAALLDEEFGRLGLGDSELRGKRVLDIGCNDGYMSLRCEQLGADVTAIDGVYRDGLKYVRQHLRPRFRFFVIDLMSASFTELGRFDIILYLGVLYHSIYPFEQLLRVASACNPGSIVFLESEFYDLPGHEGRATITFNYDGSIVADLRSPSFPSVAWITATLGRIGLGNVVELDRQGGESRGRVTLRAEYTGRREPFLFAGEQE
jgi:2-polyprenyl-3-methyl-5-hydroxy-6-metoxy-1,4-benzoquinol methylase